MVVSNGRVLKALFLLLALVGYVVTAQAAKQVQTIVVFDAGFIDTSLQGEMSPVDPAEIQRVARISEQLREGLQASGCYEIVDPTPQAKAIHTLQNQVSYLHDCNNCEIKIAKALQADLSLVAWVQKVSNLILNLNVVIKDVASGAITKTAFVDIRGNTDRTWEHGTGYMLRRRLLTDCPSSNKK